MFNRPGSPPNPVPSACRNKGFPLGTARPLVSQTPLPCVASGS
jgi:hypothetical protein